MDPSITQLWATVDQMARMILSLLLMLAATNIGLAQSSSHRILPQQPSPRLLSHPRQIYRSRQTTRRANYGPIVEMATGTIKRVRSRTTPRKRAYRLDSGDLLAVIVDGVLDFKSAQVHMPKKNNGILPAMGQPVLVLENGMIALPSVPLIPVRGLTTEEAERRVSAAYYYDKNIVKRGKAILVSLLRKRTVDVMVVHNKPNSNVRDISIVKLTPEESHVLGAVTRVGSFDMKAEIQVIQSRTGRRVKSAAAQLTDGDIVEVDSPRDGYFYTGGLLPGGEFAIPRDRRLPLLQAISIARGSIGGGRLASFPPSDLVVIRAGRPAVTVDLNSTMRNPSTVRVQSGDTLMLRYKPGEIAGNLATSVMLAPGLALLIP